MSERPPRDEKVEEIKTPEQVLKAAVEILKEEEQECERKLSGYSLLSGLGEGFIVSGFTLEGTTLALGILQHKILELPTSNLFIGAGALILGVGFYGVGRPLAEKVREKLKKVKKVLEMNSQL